MRESAELPVLPPRTFELSTTLETVDTLGLTILLARLARTDQVIE